MYKIKREGNSVHACGMSCTQRKCAYTKGLTRWNNRLVQVIRRNNSHTHKKWYVRKLPPLVPARRENEELKG